MAGTNELAAESPLVEPPRSGDPPIAHGKVLLGIEACQISDAGSAVFPFERKGVFG